MNHRLINFTAFFVLIILLFVLTGCYHNNVEKYYENGQLKERDTSTGFDPKWSMGTGKNMPLSNPSINLVGGK